MFVAVAVAIWGYIQFALSNLNEHRHADDFLYLDYGNDWLWLTAFLLSLTGLLFLVVQPLVGLSKLAVWLRNKVRRP